MAISLVHRDYYDINDQPIERRRITTDYYYYQLCSMERHACTRHTLDHFNMVDNLNVNNTQHPAPLAVAKIDLAVERVLSISPRLPTQQGVRLVGYVFDSDKANQVLGVAGILSIFVFLLRSAACRLDYHTTYMSEVGGWDRVLAFRGNSSENVWYTS